MRRDKAIISVGAGLLVILVLLSSCGLLGPKDPKSDNDGIITARLNGAEWNGDPSSHRLILESEDTLYAVAGNVENKRGISKQHLFLSIPHFGNGIYYLWGVGPEEREGGSFFIEDDHDVAIAWFYLVPEADNHLEVVSFDDVSGIIEGTFNATFAFRSGMPMGHPLRALPDTVRFTKGHFHFRIDI